MWKSEPPDVRAYYDHLSEVEKAKHRQEHPDYRFLPQKKEDKAAAKAIKAAEREASRAEAKRLKAEGKRPKKMPPPPLPFPTTSQWADPADMFEASPPSSGSNSPRHRARSPRFRPYPSRQPTAPYSPPISDSPALGSPHPLPFNEALMPSWVPPELEQQQQQRQPHAADASNPSTSQGSPSSSAEHTFDAQSSATSLDAAPTTTYATFDEAAANMGDWTQASALEQWPSLESGPQSSGVWDNEDLGDGFTQYLTTPGASGSGSQAQASTSNANTLVLDIPTPDPHSFAHHSHLSTDVQAALATLTPDLNEPFQFDLNLRDFDGVPNEIDVAFSDWQTPFQQEAQSKFWSNLMGPPDLSLMGPELAPLNVGALAAGQDAPSDYFTTPPESHPQQQQQQQRPPSLDFANVNGFNGQGGRHFSSSSQSDPFAKYTNGDASYEEQQAAGSLPSPAPSLPLGHALGLNFPPLEEQHDDQQQQHRHQDESEFEEQARNYSGPHSRDFTGPIDVYQQRVVSNGSAASSTTMYHAPSPAIPQPQHSRYAPPPGASNGGRRVGATWGNYRMMKAARPVEEEEEGDEQGLGPLDVGRVGSRSSTSSWVQHHALPPHLHRSPSPPIMGLQGLDRRVVS